MKALPVLLVALSCAMASVGAEAKDPVKGTALTAGQAMGTEPFFTIVRPIHSSGPERTFKLYRAYGTLVSGALKYRLDVCSEDGAQVLQQIDFWTAVQIDQHAGALSIQDLNGDGHVDIRLLAGFDRSRKGKVARYKVQLYDAEAQRFVPPFGRRSLSYWKEQVAKITEGMSRADVEKLLPASHPVSSSRSSDSQTEVYQLTDRHAVQIFYDYTGSDKVSVTHPEYPRRPENKVLAVPTLMLRRVPADQLAH